MWADRSFEHEGRPRCRQSVLCFGFLFLLLGQGTTETAGGESENGKKRDPTRPLIWGEALSESSAYTFLQQLCDRYGPRLPGAAGHDGAMAFLEKELAVAGLKTRRQTFHFPGWSRGHTTVRLLEPFPRELRAVGIGYSPTRSAEGELVYMESGDANDAIEEATLDGKIVLAGSKLKLTQNELARLAHERGAIALLQTNRVDGGQLLARVANHDGAVAPVPVIAITQEEGLWMKRLLDEGVPVRVRIEHESQSAPTVGTNLIATLPGDSDEKIVVGGHFDSWDLGQGAMDNGLGVAQLYEAARLLQKLSPENAHTIEFAWFDAEEFGLWGSRHYVETSPLEGIRTMVNLDMVGDPSALNAMGFDDQVPFLEAFAGRLGAWDFDREIMNKTWLGSDHHPFILKGVPAITFYAPIDPKASRYYHDFADTFDKIDKPTLAKASAMVALLAMELANQEGERPKRLTKPEVAELFAKAGLEKRMRAAGQWPFGNETDNEDN